MKTASDYLKQYPNARPSTLAFIELKRAKTEQLQREIEEAKRPVSRLMGNVRALRRLIGLGA